MFGVSSSASRAHRAGGGTTAGRRMLIVAAALLAGGAGVPFAGQALADHSVHVDPLSKASVDDRIKVNWDDPADVITYRITLQPDGATPWHYHPGPHIVSVASGTVTVYEADCRTRAYPAGSGFFDPGESFPAERQHVHVARNDGVTPAVLLVTDIRQPGGPLRVDVPAPASCF